MHLTKYPLAHPILLETMDLPFQIEFYPYWICSYHNVSFLRSIRTELLAYCTMDELDICHFHQSIHTDSPTHNYKDSKKQNRPPTDPNSKTAQHHYHNIVPLDNPNLSP